MRSRTSSEGEIFGRASGFIHEQKGRQSRFVLDEVEGGEDHGSRIGLTSGRYGKPIAFVAAGEYILGSAGVFL